MATNAPVHSPTPDAAAPGARVELPADLLYQRHLLLNRELSWLEFNRRVLEEALDRAHPLLERLKFLAIFATNLDEFFMIRVSGLKEELEEEVSEPSPDGLTPAEQLQELSRRLRPILAEHMRCLREDVLSALAAEGITITPYEQLKAAERRTLAAYFAEQVFPILTPQAVDPGHPFPYISNLSLNLGLMVEPEAAQGGAGAATKCEPRFVRIEVPLSVPRLVPLDETRTRYTFLGDLIAAHAAALFPGMRTGRCHLFRITRDADIEIREDEAGDLLRVIEQQVRRRRFGTAVRLEITASMPAEMVNYLTTALELTPDDVYTVAGPLNVPDLMALYDLPRPDLKDKPIQTVVPTALAHAASPFAAIRQRDILLHHPYTSYSTVTDFIETAARDAQVLAIKMCLYRTGRNSPIVRALMQASELGKQVAVLVELKARFDEENNIEWARQLERAGVHVVYGVLGLKTHCKVALIVRREEGALRRYVHLATGNYNPTTSRVYTDLGLLTVDPEIGADVTDLFNFLTGYARHTDFRQLLVAPVNLKARMLTLIAREREHALNSRPARIIAKLNSLTDLNVIRALYEASQAGVEIDLIVRGVCMLRPGVAGLSETIRVRSIVGRFLEHSRVFYFSNGGDEEVYIGSADWMRRNLERRVEVVAPIRDADLRRWLKDELLAVYLRDDVKARRLNADGAYERVPPAAGPPLNCQLHFAGQVA